MPANVTSPAEPELDEGAAAAAPGSDRVVRALVVGVVIIVALVMATPVIASVVGLRDGARVNSDEAVAALLPVEFVRGAPSLLFPGNSYQGVLETPVYAVLWWAAGPELVPMRLLHTAMWVAAVAVWAFLAVAVLARTTGASVRARWWAAFGVSGLLLVTSVAGWQVWYRIYPGYQLGALLAGLALLVAYRSRGLLGWGGAGLLAGLAVYAQPMHVAGAVAVVVAALVLTRPPTWWRRLLAVAVGGVIGVAPLLLWNVRNSFETFRPNSQPVQHPDWSYPQRLVNTFRVSGKVLWGDEPTVFPRWGVPLRVLVVVVLVGLAVAGLVRLVRAGRTAWPLLAVVVVCLLGLPALKALSLESDYRYAVGWWAAFVVLVAAGLVDVADIEAAGLRRAALSVLVVAVVAQLTLSFHSGANLVGRRSSAPSAEAISKDLASDLERCGVDVLTGDYWGVYPAVWGSDAELDGRVFYGPDRLSEVHPSSWRTVRRVAVISPADVADPEVPASLVTSRTGRGADGWIHTVHVGTGAPIALERTADPLPSGCLGDDGLQPVG